MANNEDNWADIADKACTWVDQMTDRMITTEKILSVALDQLVKINERLDKLDGTPKREDQA